MLLALQLPGFGKFPKDAETEVLPDRMTYVGGFDWGSACEDGKGTFAQPIASQDTVTVGSIPVDRAGVRIDLTSPKDVDIQLINEETGFEIVAWPNGDLNLSDEDCTMHHGIKICYSGYNGVGGEHGHEWIEVRGTTNRALVMKAFGYAAGDARWTTAGRPQRTVSTRARAASHRISPIRRWSMWASSPPVRQT